MLTDIRPEDPKKLATDRAFLSGRKIAPSISRKNNFPRFASANISSRSIAASAVQRRDEAQATQALMRSSRI
jgi:hypothetical protein